MHRVLFLKFELICSSLFFIVQYLSFKITRKIVKCKGCKGTIVLSPQILFSQHINNKKKKDREMIKTTIIIFKKDQKDKIIHFTQVNIDSKVLLQ